MDILQKRWDKYTTRGNDGIIDFILRTVGVYPGIAIEFGAADGIRGSNTRNLWENGWTILLIEADKDQFKKLSKNYDKCNNVFCYRGVVSLSGDDLFDNIVDRYLNNTEINFCSIDIDGLDLEVFETFQKYLPKVICIEGGQTLHPYHERIPNDISAHNIQQSLEVMNNIFEAKGYKLLASYQDSFFVKKQLYNKFNVSSNLLQLYFDGLKASSHRLPFIQKCLSECKLKNEIIDDILLVTKYHKYGWKNRKKWAEEKREKILKAIEQKYQEMKS